MNNKYMDYMVSKQKSLNTIRAYSKDINGCLEFINKNENSISLGDLISWQASISNSASATVARKTVAVKRYFDYLYKIGEIESNPSLNLESVKIVNKEKSALEPCQIRAMVDCADKVRSKAIIMLLASTGMRISEMINLTIEQYQHNPIIIQGKGRKYRTVYLSNATREMIDKYIAVRGESAYDNLFLSSGDHPMQANNVSMMLKNTAYKAGIENWKEISNHWLRTAAATMQSEAGQPIEVIQEMLGHTNISTTKRYVKISEKRKAMAMAQQLF